MGIEGDAETCMLFGKGVKGRSKTLRLKFRKFGLPDVDGGISDAQVKTVWDAAQAVKEQWRKDLLAANGRLSTLPEETDAQRHRAVAPP
uniref:Uncharacterized protein n=1 Tax=Chromera velia CCMP2878 TaxID=1169474 RepID=A0A0G4I0D3_9ALVE|eukprot:Cvel_9922.t1-p1 / transcript=Cvel_9922.t1 / gene=Cvel_9922 / organism=Chromera_velia_CCMP2878 / gene_product=hypothetical protein / transcript_product=hypothetical protein / location=Cvel_scaffold586:29535-29798(+) / protein_length=88 / sequence_SO=supercontig / SO=protein_coding / is_pseudo=false